MCIYINFINSELVKKHRMKKILKKLSFNEIFIKKLYTKKRTKLRNVRITRYANS